MYIENRPIDLSFFSNMAVYFKKKISNYKTMSYSLKQAL